MTGVPSAAAVLDRDQQRLGGRREEHGGGGGGGGMDQAVSLCPFGFACWLLRVANEEKSRIERCLWMRAGCGAGEWVGVGCVFEGEGETHAGLLRNGDGPAVCLPKAPGSLECLGWLVPRHTSKAASIGSKRKNMATIFVPLSWAAAAATLHVFPHGP